MEVLFILIYITPPVSLLLIGEDMRRSSTVSTKDNHMLRGYTIHKQRTYSLLSCAQLCLAQSTCMSFNYENIENGDCELNGEATDASIDGALTTQRGYTFGQFVILGE